MKDWTPTTCFLAGATLGLLVAMLLGWQPAAILFVLMAIGTAVAYVLEQPDGGLAGLGSTHSSARG